ncbi:hypothetical protein Tco_0303775 [Tanacetum coccineum]
MVFLKMDTEEVSDRFVAPCVVNGLEAYDGEINLGVEENMISNEYAVKLCLEHEVKRGNKIVKKELIVSLRGEIYFVKFIINTEEDDVEPGVIFRRSFLRMTKAITYFEAGTITTYPGIDPFLEDIKEEEKSMDDWDQLLDFNIDDIPLLGGEEILPFVCKIGKSNHNKKRAIENLNLFYQDIGTSSSTGRHLTQEEAAKEALAIRISQKFALLEEIRGKVNENALADTGSDINTMPYQIYEQLGREEMKKVDSGITMINHTQVEAMGILMNVLCQVGVTTLIANDDKEEYEIKRNKFGAPIYGPKPAVYLNCNDPTDRSLALQAVINLFWNISVWKKVVSLFGSLPAPLKHVNWKLDYKGCYTNEEETKGQWYTEIRTIGGNDAGAGSSRSKRSRQYETVEEVLLLQVHHEFLPWEGCNNEAKSRYNTKLVNLLPRHVYSPCVVNWDVHNGMGCDGEIDDMLRIKLREAESNKEIFIYVAWIRAFNIKEPIYPELCQEFYSTYEFDEVCADDELQTKKIIKFRLGERAHNLTLLESARLRSDDHFNAQEYWLSISREDNLGFSRIHTSTIRNPILRVIHKMITYGLCQRTTRYDKIQKTDLWLLSMFDARHQNGYANLAWLIARWMKRKGVGTQKESRICYGLFIMKISRKARVLTDVVLRSLSAPIYFIDLDTTTLKELIDFEGRLIPKDPQPGVPKVGIPRPPRESMQNLYNRMGSMEIRQEAIERMEYRQSYHWDRYQGVFEHMAGVYSVPLHGAYIPPGYAQP